MSITYHCDRCGKELSAREYDGDVAVSVKSRPLNTPEGGASVSFDLCAGCRGLLSRFFERIKAETDFQEPQKAHEESKSSSEDSLGDPQS
jgi:hypothetical protein